jgi:hypothetical protein
MNDNPILLLPDDTLSANDCLKYIDDIAEEVVARIVATFNKSR